MSGLRFDEFVGLFGEPAAEFEATDPGVHPVEKVSLCCVEFDDRCCDSAMLIVHSMQADSAIAV